MTSTTAQLAVTSRRKKRIESGGTEITVKAPISGWYNGLAIWILPAMMRFHVTGKRVRVFMRKRRSRASWNLTPAQPLPVGKRMIKKPPVLDMRLLLIFRPGGAMIRRGWSRAAGGGRWSRRRRSNDLITCR
jgi:hypothetical protein